MEVNVYDCKLVVQDDRKGCKKALKRCIALAVKGHLAMDLLWFLESPTHWKAMTEFYGLLNRPTWEIKLLRVESRKT